MGIYGRYRGDTARRWVGFLLAGYHCIMAIKSLIIVLNGEDFNVTLLVGLGSRR